jgi:TonB family protein
LDDTAKKRAWVTAAAHYRRASTLSPKTSTKIVALNALVSVYDARRLDDVNQMQATLRELIALAPDDLSYLYRLARVQEDHGFTDAAEETLLQSRRRKPDEIEPYRQLAQFYSRRITATALRKQEAQPGALGSTRPGEPDENGVYRVGGSVVAPTRVDIPYPREAIAAGAQGVVIMEVTIDSVGSVSNAKVVRSVPMLDGAAVQGVSNWHFRPTVVNGQAVPVKMMVTVNFTTP